MRYRFALESGKNAAADDEARLYDVHLKALDNLEKALNLKEPVESIARHIWQERRSHGWSYLSGEAGGQATSLFHELAEIVEKQIFKIKGRDWYYSL
jgi:hypothetical protein